MLIGDSHATDYQLVTLHTLEFFGRVFQRCIRIYLRVPISSLLFIVFLASQIQA